MKKIFLILVLLLLSGCQANYSISITDRTISEQLSFSNDFLSSKEKQRLHDTHLGIHYYPGYDIFSEIKSENKKYYSKKSEDNGNTTNINYIFDLEEYANSAIVKSCFDNFEYWLNDEESELLASGFNCFDKYPFLDTVNIKININSEIISTNGFTTDKKNYHWQIMKENVEEFDIKFIFPGEAIELGTKINTEESGSLDEDEPSNVIFFNKEDEREYKDNLSSSRIFTKDNVSQHKDQESQTVSMLVFYVVLGLLISTVIIVIIVYFINRKNNKI